MSKTDHVLRPPPADRAFIGLDAYIESDADWFAGREDEIAQVRILVQDYPFVLLTGYSGIGKTSLIRAALMPRWRADGWQCTYLSLDGVFAPGVAPLLAPPGLDSLYSARESRGGVESTPGLRGLLDQLVGESSPPGATFESAFERIAQRHADTRVLIALDQFEHLARANSAIASDLYRALESMTAGRWPNLRLLIAYRGDAEPDIGPSLQNIAGLVGGPPRCYLLPLSPDTAMQFLRTSIEAAGITLMDEDLLSTILTELQSAHDSQHATRSIYPFHLQMVGQTLCQAAEHNDGELTNSLFEELGGVQSILSNYLGRQLERLDERRREAEKILVGLVRHGPQSERQLQDSTGLEAELTDEDWSRLLTELTEARLVRLKEDLRGVGQVEVVHELLAHMIERETVQQERELRRLRGALALRAASLEQGPVLMRADVMGELYKWRERIVPSPAELQLLLQNGLMEQGPVWFWLRRISLVGLLPYLTQAHESPLPELHQAGGLALAAAATREDALVLRALMEDDDAKVRQAAARALIDIIPEMGWDDALMLRYLIEAPDAEVRRSASQALSLVLTQVGRDIIPDIPLLLRDEDPEVRFIADRTLTHIADREDIPLLRQMLQDEDLNVLNSAWNVLTQVLSRTSPADFDELRAMLTDDDLYVQGAAREALTQIISGMGPEDEALLRDLSQSDDPNVRSEARLALVGVLDSAALPGGSAELVEILRPMLDDWNADVRHVAGRALAGALASLAEEEDGGNGDVEAMTELRAMMDSSDRPLRLASAQVVTQLLSHKGRDAIPELCQLLDDPDPDIRQLARQALEDVLAQVGREAIPDLQAMLEDPNWDVWQAAGLALARVLSELGRPGLRELRGLLKEGEDPEVRRAGGQALAGVLSALGRVSLPELQMMLKDTDMSIRRAAGRALAQVLKDSGKRGISDLRRLLENEDPEIQKAAHQALLDTTSRIGSDALPLLRDVVAEIHPAVQGAAQAALAHLVAQMGRRAIPFLREMLHDRSASARHAAAAAITALDPVRGLEAWSELVVAYPLDNDEATRALVALDRELYCPFAEAWNARVVSGQISTAIPEAEN